VLDPGLSREDAAAELRRQIDRFGELRGAPPTHLDSHKHHHARPELLAAFASVGAELRLPIRAMDDSIRNELRRAGVRTTEHFLGDADLRPCWSPERLLAAVVTLPDATSELMCHPGYAPSHARTSFGAEREIELRAVCDPRVREALTRAGVVLISFREL
jgi:predicted glycoside hydrolase/deacetylase ChbG (UPF0249 family)